MVENLVWGAQPYRARHAMVASGEANATEAGVTVLKHGGNAMDAAVAMAFVLGVTHSGMCGLGGGGYVLLRMADGRSLMVPHRDLVSMSPGGRTIIVYREDESFSIVDLLLVNELDMQPPPSKPGRAARRTRPALTGRRIVRPTAGRPMSYSRGREGAVRWSCGGTSTPS